MRQYRLVLLLKSGLSKDQKEKLLSEVKSYAGNIEKDNLVEYGEKKLAFPIKNEKKGEYISLEFSSDKVMDELERHIVIHNGVLRHLLVRS